MRPTGTGRCSVPAPEGGRWQEATPPHAYHRIEWAWSPKVLHVSRRLAALWGRGLPTYIAPEIPVVVGIGSDVTAIAAEKYDEALMSLLLCTDPAGVRGTD